MKPSAGLARLASKALQRAQQKVVRDPNPGHPLYRPAPHLLISNWL